MFYEVDAKLQFTSEDEARDFYHDCQLALAKAQTINPGQPNAEPSTIQWLLSNHDLSPNLPSTIIDSASTPL